MLFRYDIAFVFLLGLIDMCGAWYLDQYEFHVNVYADVLMPNMLGYMQAYWLELHRF